MKIYSTTTQPQAAKPLTNKSIYSGRQLCRVMNANPALHHRQTETRINLKKGNIMIKKLLAISLIVSSTVACAKAINYNPDYIWAEYQKCNKQPYEAVVTACQSEKEDGAAHMPGCEAVGHVDMLIMGANFFKRKTQTNQCAK